MPLCDCGHKIQSLFTGAGSASSASFYIVSSPKCVKEELCSLFRLFIYYYYYLGDLSLFSASRLPFSIFIVQLG